MNHGTPKTPAWGFWGFQSLNSLAMSLTGFLILRLRPQNRVGWLLLASGILAGLTGLSEEYAWYATRTHPSLATSGVLVAGLGHWLWLPAYGIVAIHLPLIFPDGRYLSHRWRIVGGLGGLWMLLGSAWLILYPGPLTNFPALENPFGQSWPLFATLALPPDKNYLPALLPGQGLMVLAAISLVLRYRRSGTMVRQQLKWFAYAAALMPLAGVLGQFNGLGFDVLLYLTVATLPVSIAIAILRHGLYDINRLIHRTLVYGTLTTLILLLYGLLVGGVGTLVPPRDQRLLSLLAIGLAAVLFQPLRERLQRAVNRLMYGERDDPYAVLTRLGKHLESALTPTAGLQRVVETVARALKLPHVAIALREGERFKTVASFGSPGAAPLTLPLTHREEIIGQLICTPRAPGEGFTEAEQDLLRNVARQTGPVAYSVGLTADLQRSRERLVTAREEERRRIRRDLHDGLGPQLASLTLKLDAARNLLPRDPAAADALLCDLKAEAQAAIADIRRLVYDLRPPALDELGLVGALREYAASLTTPEGLCIRVEAPEQLPPLPAAVEVAAYRIALEALTNVERHARARQCVVRLALTDNLHLEILDDGIGLPPQSRAGVGLASMRERAAELGGRCVAERRPEGGTRIWAELPVHGEVTR